MRSVVLAAAATAGFLSLAPAAFAAEAPTAPSTSTTTEPTTAPTTTAPDDGGQAGVPKAFIAVVPGAAHAGTKVTVRVGCEAGSISKVSSPVLKIGKLRQVGPQHDPAKAPVSEASATVLANAKPGVYRVSFDCGGADITSKFTVVPTAPRATTTQKQVSKVPSGAPQTGGTDGPVGDGGPDAAVIALAGAGAVALGGSFVLYRRRRAQS